MGKGQENRFFSHCLPPSVQRTHVDREYDTQCYTWQFKGHTLTGPFSCGGQATPTASRRTQTFQNCVQMNASLILDFNLSFKRIFLFPSPQLPLPLFFLRHSPLFVFVFFFQLLKAKRKPESHPGGDSLFFFFFRAMENDSGWKFLRKPVYLLKTEKPNQALSD